MLSKDGKFFSLNKENFITFYIVQKMKTSDKVALF